MISVMAFGWKLLYYDNTVFDEKCARFLDKCSSCVTTTTTTTVVRGRYTLRTHELMYS